MVAEQAAGVSPWLRVTNLVKTYGGVAALRGVGLELRTGEIRGLVGANGAGKSTLVKILTGVTAPDSGVVAVDGRPLRPGRPHDALQAGIAAVPQELTVAAGLTVAENVMLGHEPAHTPGFLRPRELRRRARQAVDSLGHELPLDEPVGRLSLIDRRFVMIARALSYDTRLVIFDEPTAAVSPREVGLLHDAIRRLSARGVAVLYVSHHLREIENLCESATVLRDGDVSADLERPSHAQLVLELAPAAEPTAVGARRSAPAADAVAGEPVLVVRGLGGERLEGVDLIARRGQIVGLAGLAGSGARELLLTIAGAVPWERGEIELNGRPLRSGSTIRSVAAGAGLLPGDRSLAVFPTHTVRHNVSLPSVRTHATGPFVRREAERRAVTALIERVGLRSGTEARISALSGGNQQKAVVARWIASGAALLLLDDPTSGVDVATRPEIHAQVVALAAAGAAVLLVSTDMDELADLCDRVVVFAQGTVSHELEGSFDAAGVLAATTGTATREGAI
ncbi:MAG: sugar ABC transporter ATP-binding protein [Gaiellaceae bacterium]